MRSGKPPTMPTRVLRGPNRLLPPTPRRPDANTATCASSATHDRPRPALIRPRPGAPGRSGLGAEPSEDGGRRSEEHTSELQSRFDLVCRLLLEKKKYHNKIE